MMEQFSRALVKVGIAAAGVLSILLIGVGVLLLWKPALILNILVYGIAGGCLLFSAAMLLSLLAASFKG